MSKRNLTTSILGDAGSAEATVVPNLESLNTGADQYITSISDTSEFNVFGQMKIYDNYWDTFFARHIVNAANAGSALGTTVRDAIIQSNTEGWVRADHMVLQVPVTFTYTARWNKCELQTDELHTAVVAGVGRIFDNYYTTNVEINYATSAYQMNNPANQYTPYSLERDRHAWFGVIDSFNRLRLLIGNNGQQVQKQIETEPIGMKYHMAHNRMGQVVEQVQNQWGVANPIGSTRYEVTEPSGLYGSACIDKMITPYEENKTYFDMLSEIGPGNWDTIAPIVQGTARFQRVTKTRLLPLPLQSIMPFFRGAKFLPPDFRFKFEIQTNSGNVIASKLMPWARYTVDAQAFGSFNINPTDAGAGVPVWTTNAMATGEYTPHTIMAAINANGIELQYPWHVLRQPVQAAISAMWLQKPFLYNYETIQLTEITPTTNSKNIHFAISISTQRPTVLDVYLFPQQSTDRWGQYNLLEHPAVGTILRIKDTPTTEGAPDFTNLQTSIAGPVCWTDFEIMFSGRTAYRFRNDQYETKTYGVDSIHSSEFFIKLFEEQSFRSTATEYNSASFAERESGIMFNNRRSNKIMRINIQPGGWTDRGVISSRQGATTITVNVTFANRLSSLDRFCVIRTNPEQCVFDSDKNVTLIQWPAVKSNSGYLIPNITAAP